MRYVQMNSKVRGIIACCSPDGIVSLDACEHSGKPDICKQTDIYMSEHILCIFFPLAEGEMITGAWLREEKHFISRELILVLNTSSQRTRTFGPYFRPERQHQYRYQPLLEKNAYQITGFCYNDRGCYSSAQRRFGVTSADEPLGTLPDEPFQATHTLPNLPILYWFKSSGSFTGVSHVRLCVDTKKPHEPTVGMLLLYEDRQESLGQWRYDCEIRDYELNGRMYFFPGETKSGPYTKISCNDEMKDGWIEIPQTAEVLWWFKSNCSRLEIVSV
ncbi:hypothetical protein GMOD_00009865 [Pyrenophora seminiperda CCB06]|uniref:Uncharacterized protein n=1 Tax=Pyrenophora seminiperda CCB06 TaxID=1302712 RepID=A0A3M7ME87_9PLEO|nr:hypothetical protein GMOD_00009865 [Pyrenophora seminiperda CCB06]